MEGGPLRLQESARSEAPFRCGACGRAWYCSRSCQAEHWKTGHKAACAKLKATAAASPEPTAAEPAGAEPAVAAVAVIEAVTAEPASLAAAEPAAAAAKAAPLTAAAAAGGDVDCSIDLTAD
jgi:hypothetical protein